MRRCCYQHSCMSSAFSMLNFTCIFHVDSRSFGFRNLIKLTYESVFESDYWTFLTGEWESLTRFFLFVAFELAKEVQVASGPPLVQWNKTLREDGFQKKVLAIREQVEAFAEQFPMPGNADLWRGRARLSRWDNILMPLVEPKLTLLWTLSITIDGSTVVLQTYCCAHDIIHGSKRLWPK